MSTNGASRRGLFEAEIMRFLTSDRTRNYERQADAWWTRDDLKLVVVKRYGTDCPPDELFPEIEAALNALIASGRLQGTGSYRAK